MIEGFLHPALAAGAALAAVPLVIHLLNRQRYRPTPWAAMRFVLAAHKRTRRRVQLENLLLLMLRMGAVALLALAVARPFVSGGGALGVLTERRREVVLVLDGSASTGLQVGAESTFATLRARAVELAEKLDGSAGDRLHVLLMGATTRLVSWPTPEKAALVLPTLTSPTDERADLAAALVEALDIVREGGSEEEQSSGAEVRVLSDLQADLFLDEEGGTRQGVLDALDAFEALGVTVVLEDATGGVLRPDNTSVSGISLPPGPLRAGEPTEILVQLRHLASGPRVAARVTLEIDGNRLPSQRVDLDPEGRAEARFPHTFTEAGPHSLVATVDGDGLAADDTRASVLVVPDPIRVLVVNGSPAERLLDDEAGFLVLALRAPEADGLPSDFEVEEVTASALAAGEVELKGRDVIWLAGVPPLPEGVCLDLEARVAAGAGLVMSCGDGMSDLEGVGARLFRADGSGLLPAEPIARTRSPRRESYFRVLEFDGTDPVLAFFDSERHRPLLTEVPIQEFVRSRPLPDARVLATLDDDARSPLLVTRPFLDGQVWLWTTSIGRSWTPLPQLAPVMIPLVVEWVRAAARREPGQRDGQPGLAPRLEVEAFPRGLTLVRPDGTRRAISGEPEPTSRGGFLLPAPEPADLARAGLYRVELEGAPTEPFAVVLPPEESELRRSSPAELEGLHAALRVVAPESAEEGADPVTGGPQGELWRVVAWACLAFLVGESLWGARLGGRGRRVHA
jgi:hypothetical protein